MLSPKCFRVQDLQGFDVGRVTSSFCHVTMCSGAVTHGLLHPLTLRSLRSKRLEGRGPPGDSRASMVRDGACAPPHREEQQSSRLGDVELAEAHQREMTERRDQAALGEFDAVGA